MSASYDKTIRLFNVAGQRSHSVYHTKRMQRVLCCQFSTDGRFVFSGSEDHNVRVWKAKASQKLGAVSGREKKAQLYRETLMEKYSSTKEVSRIKNYTHVPKAILNAAKREKVKKEMKKRKTENRRAHSKPGAVPFESERGKVILGENE